MCFQFTHLLSNDWENIHTLSYYHHQIRSMNYYPLFRVRSWNNGMCCMSFYILNIIVVSHRGQWVNSLWPSDAIRRQGTESTLAQVLAGCLTAPSHYLNQCWLIISKVLYHTCLVKSLFGLYVWSCGHDQHVDCGKKCNPCHNNWLFWLFILMTNILSDE